VNDSNEPADAPSDKLTPDEDAVLRRLHWFEQFGVELAPRTNELKTDIRARDKRDEIREPPDVVDAEPVYDPPDELDPPEPADDERPPADS
jgi:hypothetical protein